MSHHARTIYDIMQCFTSTLQSGNGLWITTKKSLSTCGQTLVGVTVLFGMELHTIQGMEK